MRFFQTLACFILIITFAAPDGNITCSLATITNCTLPFASLQQSDYTDVGKMCKLTNEAMDCMERVSNVCPDSMKMDINISQHQIDEFKKFCVNTEDGASGCSIEGMMACTNFLMDLPQEKMSNLDIVCQRGQDVKDCLEKKIKSCPESMKDVLIKFRQQTDQSLSMCGDQLKNGASGCSKKGIMVCTKFLMDLPPEQLSNLDIICRRGQNAMDCVEKEIKSCPESMQAGLNKSRQQIDEILSMCDDDCSMKNIVSCTKSLMTLPQAQLSNLDTVCRIAQNAKECLEKRTKSCSESMKAVLNMSRQQIDKSLSMCGDKLKSATHLCGYNVIMTCAKPLMDIYHEEQPDLKIVCQKVDAAFECMEKKMGSCPKSDYSYMDNIPKETEQYKAMCSNNETGKNKERGMSGAHDQADGLKSSIFLPLVAAMFVMLRHFL